MVTVGLVYDQVRPDERMIIDAAKQKGIALQLVDTNNLPFEVTPAASSKDSTDSIDVYLQRCISFYRSIHATAILESQGKPVINPYHVSSICGDKLLASLKLYHAGVPTPRTFLAFSTRSATIALEKLGYPAVMKPVVGSWGRLVAVVKDPQSVQALIEAHEYMHPIQQLYYLQEKIDRPHRDIRCYVIGEQAVAAIYRYSTPNDWRTNTALGGYAEKCDITPELEELSIKAAKAVGGGAFGVDLMETKNGLVVHEVNHTTEFKNTVRVTGVSIPTLLLDYAMSQVKR